MAFKKSNNNNTIITYPDPESVYAKIPLVVFVGGVTSYSFALKESMEQKTSENLKSRAIFVFKNHKESPSIKECIEIGKNIAKENKIEISDVKLLGYSGGAEDIRGEISDTYSYVGLIDPSVHSSLETFSKVASRVRMTYNPNAWGNSPLGPNQPLFAAEITKNGGKAELTDWAHKDAVSKFLGLFSEEIAKPVEDPAKNVIKPTSELNPTAQPQFGNIPVPILPPPREQSSRFDFENKESFATIDKIGPTLDRKTTTINGVISLAAERFLFKKNYFEGIEYFKGQVLRVNKINYVTGSSYLSFVANLIDNTITSCKVRVPELHANLPNPNTFDQSIQDIKIIDIYPDFIYDPFIPAFQTVKVGDIVEVTYENLSNFSGGKILNVLGEQAKGLASSGSYGVSFQDVKNYFLNKSQENVSVGTLPDIKKLIENEDKSQEIAEVIKTIPSETTLIVKLKNGKTVARKGNRNWRNNNPGNIEYKDHAKSSGAIGTDGRFAIFPTFEKGINSLFKLLKGNFYSNKSLFGAMSAYAPPSENDTAGYVAKIEKAVGVSSETKISQLNSVQFETFVSTILKVEGYIAGSIKEVNIS